MTAKEERIKHLEEQLDVARGKMEEMLNHPNPGGAAPLLLAYSTAVLALVKLIEREMLG